ncbi:MAG: CRTAC1 family protein, partial [Anaerolineae bacterium]
MRASAMLCSCRFVALLLGGVLLVPAGCRRDGGSAVAQVREQSLAAPGGGVQGLGEHLLTGLAPQETGIDHQNVLPQERTGRFLHAGAGVAAADYDGDGLVDVYLVSETGRNHLYRNLGGWRFEDTTEAAGATIPRQVEAGHWKERFPTCAKFFDIDGDGDQDLFVCAFAGAATLFENDGDGTFTDVTADAGVGYVGASTAAAVADYDRDGDLDLYLATYRPFGLSRYFPPGTAPADEPELRYDIEGPLESYVLRAEPDALYRNRGDGTFDEVSRAAGIVGRDFGLAAKFADVDFDGWPDLYVADDFETPDRFYHNDGDGRFSEMPVAALRHTPWFSMGLDFGDFNNDGIVDLMTSDMVSRNRVRRLTQSTRMLRGGGVPPESAAAQLKRNSLFLGNGDGTWTDVARYAGVAATEWTWTVKFADMDLDGRSDLLVTNGFVRDDMNADEALRVQVLKRARPPLLTGNFAFRNVDGLRFEDVSKAWGFDSTAIGNGMALADLDGDGDLDAVVNNMNAVAGVYRNDSGAHRLKVSLRGAASNTMGLGARLTLDGVDGVPGVQVREMSVGGGYMSGHEAVVVFGLGQATSARRLTVDWPSGRRTVLEDVAADRHLTIVEPNGPVPTPQATTASAPQFVEVAEDLGIRFRHDETDFDDLMAQPLLPLRLSRLGPGVAWGDWNDDGWDDLAVAGARGQATGLFISRAGNSFDTVAVAPPPGAVEAMAPLILHVAGAQRLLETTSRVESAADRGVVALEASRLPARPD